jgi:predicted HTH domain antitoxin
MTKIALELDESLIEILRQVGPTAERAALELIVLELFRRAEVSGGKAAQLLGVSRLEFIQRAGAVGIPFTDYTEEEWEAESRTIAALADARRRSATPAR